MELLLPDLPAALRRFLTAESSDEITAAIKTLPERATRPAMTVQTLGGVPLTFSLPRSVQITARLQFRFAAPRAPGLA